MRKRLIASVFITFLVCAPALAGHVIIGGGWCAPCDTPGCLCDPGEESMGNRISHPNKPTQDIPADFGSGTLFVLAALILVLRYKA